jgi:hypothetical protein
MDARPLSRTRFPAPPEHYFVDRGKPFVNLTRNGSLGDSSIKAVRNCNSSMHCALRTIFWQSEHWAHNLLPHSTHQICFLEDAQ